jgi:uncharacterized short protein YbdD (DUF466 family)
MRYPRLRTRVRELCATMARVIRRVVGAPDYDAYLHHASRCDPGLVPLSREAFARDALARRYDRPGSRCC